MGDSNTGKCQFKPIQSIFKAKLKDKSFNIPAALFLNLICQSVNMPDEHAIIVIALIDRFCNKVVDLSYDTNRFYKKIPREGQKAKYCCRELTINSQTIHK